MQNTQTTTNLADAIAKIRNKGTKARINGVQKAIGILEKGDVVSGNDFFWVHVAIREMMGKGKQALLTFEQRSYFQLSDGRIIVQDYESKSAYIATAQHLEKVREKRNQRIQAELNELLKNKILDITHSADIAELMAELGASQNPIHVEGGEGSDSHCPWRKFHYSLKDGRTLVVGNRPDEGRSTAMIR